MKKAIAFIFLITSVLVFAVTAYAKPETVTEGSAFGSTLTGQQILQQAFAIESEYNFKRAFGQYYNNLLAITCQKITNTDTGIVYFKYYVIVSMTDGTKTEAGAQGYQPTTNKIKLTQSDTVYRMYYNNDPNGGVSSVSQSVAYNVTEYTLLSDEQVVYTFADKTIGKGVNYNSTYIAQEEGVTLNNAQKWINAFGSFEGVIDDDSYNQGYTDGKSVGWSEGLTEGYNRGYTIGRELQKQNIDNIKTDSYNEGYQAGYNKGSEDGYQNAVEEIETGAPITVKVTENLDIPGIITAIPNAVKTIINDGFGFSLFGINIGGLLITIIVLAIVITLITVLYKVFKK